MKVTFSNFFKLSIVLIVVLLTVSCDKESDLLAEYVLSDDLHKEQLDGFAMDDFSRTINDQGAVLEVLVQDSYSD